MYKGSALPHFASSVFSSVFFAVNIASETIQGTIDQAKKIKARFR
jgi:hypothetical protein